MLVWSKCKICFAHYRCIFQQKRGVNFVCQKTKGGGGVKGRFVLRTNFFLSLFFEDTHAISVVTHTKVYKGQQRLIDKRGGMVQGRWRGHEPIAAKTSWLPLLYALSIIGVCPEYRLCMPRGHPQCIALLPSLPTRGFDRVVYIASPDSSSPQMEYGWSQSTDISI